MDLYEILGLEQTATDEEIKIAYRAAVKKAHPDHGGDPEQFSKVQHAYKVLRDKDLKKQYDLTGVDATGELEDTQQRARVYLANLYDEALNTMLSARQPERAEPLEMMETQLERHQKENETLQKEAERFLDVIMMASVRMQWNGTGEDSLGRVASYRKVDLEKIIEGCKKRRKDLMAAKVILGKYTYTRIISGQQGDAMTNEMMRLRFTG